MTSQQVTKGSGYNTNLSYNGLTNRIATPGYGYDANGNLTAMPALSMAYDAQNRMVSSTPTSGATTVYAYGPGGQRVGQSAVPDPNNWQNNRWSIYVYGPDGRRVADCGASYVPPDPQYPQTVVFQSSCLTAYVHFRGALVRKENMPQLVNGVWQYWGSPGKTVGTDRLGSVRYWSSGATSTSYYPYGEEETPTGNDTQKYATYTRDSATGLDYAMNRYYASQIGRFTTADPGGVSTNGGRPQTWNRYVYAGGDPVNSYDPDGLFTVAPGGGGGGGRSPSPTPDFTPQVPSPECWAAFLALSGGTPQNGFTDQNTGIIRACEGAAGAFGPPIHTLPGGSGPNGTDLVTSMVTQVMAAVQLAANLINHSEQCEALLGRGNGWVFVNVFGGDVAAYLMGLFTNGDIVINSVLPNGEGFPGPATGAVTTPGGNGFTYTSFPSTTGLVAAPQITINPDGMFFSGQLNGTAVQNIPNSGFAGLTNLADIQAAMILHELGHATGVFGDDYGPGIPRGTSAGYTADVVANCFPH